MRLMFGSVLTDILACVCLQNLEHALALARMPAGPRVPQESTPSGEMYHCGVCGHTTRSSRGMKYHQDKHRGIYPYTCPYCNKGHLGTSNLRRHLNSVHNIRDPLRCLYCTSIEAKVTDYVKHVGSCTLRPVEAGDMPVNTGGKL